jgi:hypothetical protein
MFCLALGLNQGCARSERLKPETASASSSGSRKQLPFHADIQQAAASQGPNSANSPDPRLPGTLPFPSASRRRVLPSGTLLTVQLEGPLSTAKVHAGDAFAASVAAPLVVEGETVIERGAEVAGRVEAAQSRPGSGYVRLTLKEITVGGAPIALQTSSLFARGTVKPLGISSSNNPSRNNPSAQQSGSIGVPKGRRLTFRLIAPVTLNDSNPMERPRSLATTTE